MDSTMKIGLSTVLPISYYSSSLSNQHNSQNKIGYGFRFSGSWHMTKICAITPNGSVSPASHEAESRVVGDAHRRRSSLESLFCHDKPIPEERIEKPIGISLAEKLIGDNLRCTDCQAKGAVLCTTCSGSGLYVDSILESQGIIVKVRCLGWRNRQHYALRMWWAWSSWTQMTCMVIVSSLDFVVVPHMLSYLHVKRLHFVVVK